MTNQTQTQTRLCRACSAPVTPLDCGPAGLIWPRYCSDECLATDPDYVPEAAMEAPSLTLEQRREREWTRMLKQHAPRQLGYDFAKLRPRAQQAGRDLRGYRGEHSVLITGASEAGKSYVAYRLARLAFMHGVRVELQTAEGLRAEWLSENGGEKVLARAKRVPLLLLDDVGMENASSGWVSALYEVISHRENHERATIVTVNRAREDFEELYSPALANRLWRMQNIEL